MTRLVVGDKNRPPEPVLVDRITFTAAEAEDLLELLQSNQQALEDVAKLEAEERRHRMGQAYAILIAAAEQRRVREGQEASGSHP